MSLLVFSGQLFTVAAVACLRLKDRNCCCCCCCYRYQLKLSNTCSCICRYSETLYPRFSSNPLIIRVPCFLLFGLNMETPNQKRAKGNQEEGPRHPCRLVHYHRSHNLRPHHHYRHHGLASFCHTGLAWLCHTICALCTSNSIIPHQNKPQILKTLNPKS